MTPLLHLQCCPGGGLEHLADTLLRLSRALEVSERVDLLCHGTSFLVLHRLLFHLLQLLDRVRVIPQILLVSHQDYGNVGAEVTNLGGPLLRDVLQTVGTVDGETHENDVGVGVGEWTQTVVVLLASRVPQCKLYLRTETYSNI